MHTGTHLNNDFLIFRAAHSSHPRTKVTDFPTDFQLLIQLLVAVVVAVVVVVYF